LAAWSAEPTDVRFTASPVHQVVSPRPSLTSAVTPSSDDGSDGTDLAPRTADLAPAEPKPQTLALAEGPAAPQGAVPSAAPAGAPKDIDRYVGAYEITRFVAMIVSRQGDALVLQQQQGPPPEQFTRGADGVWTGAQSGRRFVFDVGPDGQALDLSFADGPVPGTMKRLPDGAVDKRAVELAARIKAQTPDNRTEGVIRELIGGLREGSVNYDRFGERMGINARATFPDMQSDFKSLGDLKSLAFKGVGPGGGDIYDATFANGIKQFRVLLDAQGRIDAMSIQQG
jgi:hypothetical protein